MQNSLNILLALMCVYRHQTKQKHVSCSSGTLHQEIQTLVCKEKRHRDPCLYSLNSETKFGSTFPYANKQKLIYLYYYNFFGYAVSCVLYLAGICEFILI